MLNDSDFFKTIYEKHRKRLIDPDDMDDYLSNFKEKKVDLFQKEKLANSRILITGITGFVGSHLAEKLASLNQNIEIYGMIRRQSVPLLSNLHEIKDKIKLEEANLIDYSSIETLINKIEPEYIFHLAAQSFVPTSFIAPIESVDINIKGTVNLLEVLRKNEIDLKSMQVACSSEEYGLVHPNEIPITEDNPFRPQSPYAVSKVATELYSLNYFRAYGLPVKVTRGFNHTGPRRGLQFVTSVIAHQLVRAMKSDNKDILIGNPDPIRDFTDIRDMIQGYILSLIEGKDGEVYNLGHGFGISIKDVVKLAARIFNVDYKLIIDKSRYRPSEVNILICDYTKANREIGYRPQYPITETLENVVNYYISNNNPYM